MALVESVAAVSVIIPALNEESYIETCINSLLGQRGCNILEIIVVDGGSSDRTVSIVAALARKHSTLRLMHNPKRIQSAAFNLAAAQSDTRTRILVRADAHVFYPPDFVEKCVTAMTTSGATSVAVPMRTVGVAGFQRAVAAAQNSKLGNGGSAHRQLGGKPGFVDHGHHAAFDKAFFLDCGGYDESFTHNEDAEFDHRARLAGGRVWMCTDTWVDYFPRSTPGALARQYLRNGRGRCRTMLKHHMRPRLRQSVPVLVVLGIMASLFMALLWPWFLVLPLAYVLLCFSFGLVTALRQRDAWLSTAGFAAIIMHLSFGAGVLRQLATVARPGAD